MNKEKWKRCVTEKGYLISSWGRIFSLRTERVLRPYIHKSRAGKYLRIELNGKKYMVHVLMGYTFKRKELKILKENYLEAPNMVFQVNHKDRNTLNCNLNNIEWETEMGNKIHMHETNIITFGGKTYKGKFE